MDDLTAKQCPVEYTLSQISGKWRIMILKELSRDPVRYAAIGRAIQGISPKILIGQLREMEKECLVVRTIFPEVPPRVEYSLSKTGVSVFAMLSSMRDWGLEAGGGDSVECRNCEKCIPRNYRFEDTGEAESLHVTTRKNKGETMVSETF